ncbi:MAG: nodulation protein NfeD [Deferribacterales bacterium]|nr:nodulation protein NfeD [Deferribacterales bacterium]
MKYFLYVLLLAALVLPAYAIEPTPKTAEETSSATLYVIKADEIITQSTAERVKEAVKQASEDKNGYLLIELNTPGGVLEATRNIVQHIMASSAPVTVYVTPSGARAASAGMFIALAADFAVMENGTNIGAAHPVNADGKDIEGDMRAKVENDTLAFVRSIAEKRGRNIAIAEKMVSQSTSYTASEALKENIIDAEAGANSNITQMIKERFHINGEIKTVTIEPTFLQSVHKFLANPNILAALLFMGMFMIGLEFKIPGTFIFAGIGVACFIIFAIGASIIPINYFAIILVIAGLILMAADIFVTSFGLLSIGGIGCLFFGLRMLFDSNSSTGIGVSPVFTITVTAIAAITVLIIGRLVVKDFKRRPATGMENLIDKHATVIDWNGNKGRVTIYGEIWNAKGGTFAEGDEVIIESFESMTLTVRKSAQ